MLRNVARTAILVVSMVAISQTDLLGNRSAEAGVYRVSRGDDLFCNHYVGPSPYAGGSAGAMYPAPLPTSPLVGHTYITYQPLMPQEFLYRHHRSYHRHHPGRGWVSTRVSWW